MNVSVMFMQLYYQASPKLLAAPKKGGNLLKPFVPTKADFSWAGPLAPYISAFLDLVLGVIGIGGLVFLVIGAAMFVFGGRRNERHDQSVDMMKRGGVGLVVAAVGAVIISAATGELFSL